MHSEAIRLLFGGKVDCAMATSDPVSSLTRCRYTFFAMSRTFLLSVDWFPVERCGKGKQPSDDCILMIGGLTCDFTERLD